MASAGRANEPAKRASGGRFSRSADLRRLLERLAGRLDVPQDVVLDLPKATLIGDLQLHIQNHRGVIEYTPRKLRVGSSKGELVVVGTRMVIASIYGGELVVEGRISGVHYLR